MKSPLTRKAFTSFTVATTALVAVSCGTSKDGTPANPSTDHPSPASGSVASAGGTTATTTELILPASVPADSTGAEASVALVLGPTAPAAAALDLLDAAPSSFDLGNGILITKAELNIGSIKVKAGRDRDESEKAVHDKEKKEQDDAKVASKVADDAIDKRNDDLKKEYEPLFKAAKTDADKDSVRAEFKAKQAVIKKDLADLKAAEEAAQVERAAAHDKSLKWKGPYVYELVSNTVTPAIPSATLVDGSYERVEFKLRPNRDVAAADPLLDQSVYVEGSVLVNGVATPFQFSSDVEEEFRLTGAGAVRMLGGATNALAIAFDAKSWFTGVDIGTGAVDASGTLVLTPQSNPTLWKAVERNVKSSTRFGKDDDGDGKLSAGEAKGDGKTAVAEDEKVSGSPAAPADAVPTAEKN